MSMGSFSLFFWFMVKFFRLCQPSQTCSFFLIPIFWGFMIFHKTKALIFLGVLPLFCFLSSRTTKSLNFFILFSDFLQYLCYCMQRRWKKTLIYKNLLFLSQTIVAMAGNFDRKSTDSGDRVANNQEATKLE
ncbi:hypothetical protein AAZX31_09G061400 [Glycine max]